MTFSNNPAPAHCWVLTAAIIMQKLPGSVKLTCPENLCHIRRRLENWKHEDLPATGYIYNLYSYICPQGPRSVTKLLLRRLTLLASVSVSEEAGDWLREEMPESARASTW